jgi:uncharacterized membrane protein YidH (DUF202 family)
MQKLIVIYDDEPQLVEVDSIDTSKTTLSSQRSIIGILMILAGVLIATAILCRLLRKTFA